MKLQAAYQIKPKKFKKKPTLATSKIKNMFNLVHYPGKDSCKNRKSSRKTDFKSTAHIKTKSTMGSFKTLKSNTEKYKHSSNSKDSTIMDSDSRLSTAQVKAPGLKNQQGSDMTMYPQWKAKPLLEYNTMDNRAFKKN